jgi:hypothetical protein
MRERFNRYVDDLTLTGKMTIIIAIAGFGLLIGAMTGRL